MKKFKCYDCDVFLKSDNRAGILSALYAHYMKAHPTIIPNASAEEKKAWMERFEKDWIVAEDV